MKLNKKLIPKGMYCYTYNKNGERKICPYHATISCLPHQLNGYCLFLKISDFELSQERNEKAVWRTGDGKIVKEKRFLPLGLLWDMCKECDINDD